MIPTIGLLELNSIAKGIETTDAMLKEAEVTLLFGKVVCPGKFLVLIAGKVGAVKASILAGERVGENSVLDKLVIPNLHPDVIPALTATTEVSQLEALGVIETFTAASSIIAADAAAKAGKVKLIEVRLAVGMGGKSFVTFTGGVHAVESAIQAGIKYPQDEGLLVQKVVIPRPIEDLGEVVI
ncbi:BMC domain-containing protein [bacterium]|nr:BMC domain-containing protein [bacterium]